MSKFNNEREMAVMVNKEFSKVFEVIEEFPISGRCADALLIDNKFGGDGTLISIEYKLKDKKTAFKQALDHKHSVNLAYIVMPDNIKFKEEYKEKCKKYGIGLIKFDGKDFDIVLTPKYHKLWDKMRESIFNTIEKIKEE